MGRRDDVGDHRVCWVRGRTCPQGGWDVGFTTRPQTAHGLGMEALEGDAGGRDIVENTNEWPARRSDRKEMRVGRNAGGNDRA